MKKIDVFYDAKIKKQNFYWLKFYWECNINQLSAQNQQIFCTIVILGWELKYLYIPKIFLGVDLEDTVHLFCILPNKKKLKCKGRGQHPSTSERTEFFL